MNKKLYIFVILIIFSATAKSQDSIITLGKAYKDGVVTVDIKSKGGFTGNVILMKIKNIFSSKRKIRIEAGRRLYSKDSTEQDILIVKTQVCELDPGTEKTLDVYGMCCQRYNSSPGKESEFEIGEMADTALVNLAIFISNNNLYSSDAAQNAVWVISDNCRAEGIHSINKTEQKKLQKYISAILKIPVSWYTLEYARDSIQLFSDKPFSLDGDFEYEISTNALVSMGFYSEKGELIKTIFYQVAHNPGTYSQCFQLNVAMLPKGVYYAKAFADGNLIKERKVIL